MISYLKKIAGCIFAFAILALLPTTVCAYVLQGQHILQLTVEKMGQARSLLVSQKVFFYNLQPQGETSNENTDPESLKGQARQADFGPQNPADSDNSSVPSAVVELDESLRYLFSEAFRSEIVSDDNQRLFIVKGGQTLTVIDGVISGVGETRFDLYKDLLLYRSRERLCERLSQLGIDVAISSLGKFEGHYAFVVGAEYPDLSRPQVWVEMETFQPLRMLLPDRGSLQSSGFLEIRYLRWQEIGSIQYPMRIAFLHNGRIVRAIEVGDCRIDPHFAKDLFDIDRLKLQYRHASKAADRPAENEGLSEVQKTIEEFKKIFD